MMIELNDKYIIGFDEMNIILYEKINSKGGNRKKYKDSYLNAIGFFGDFKSLLNHLVKHQILCSREDFSTLQDILNAIEDFKNELSIKIKAVIE